ncbi:hypothetical protein ACWGJ2_15150 [Streptomyces sp. NPDC054796]
MDRHAGQRTSAAPSAPPPLPKRHNAVLGLYDAPLYRDWAFWMTLAWGLLAAVAIPSGRDDPGTTSTLPVWLDTTLAVIVFTLLFGVVPTWLRLPVRQFWWRRRRPSPSSGPTHPPRATPSPQWSPPPPAPAQPPHPAHSAPPPVTPPQPSQPSTGKPPGAGAFVTYVESGPPAGSDPRTSPPLLPAQDLIASPVLEHARHTLPHPVARAVRALQRASTGMDRYQALLDAAEILAATVSVTAAAFLNAEREARYGPGTPPAVADPDSPVDLALMRLAANYRASGITFGTWPPWLENLVPALDAAPHLAPGLRATVLDGPEGPEGQPGPGLATHLRTLQSERNRWAHGDKPRGHHEAALRVSRCAAPFERALEQARFLGDTPWLLTVSCAYRPRARTYEVVAQHVMGDHPDFARRTFTSTSPLADDTLYARRPEGPVPLSPFAAPAFCEQCLQTEICYLYQAAKKPPSPSPAPPTLKSFASGHSIPAPGLDEETDALPRKK